MIANRASNPLNKVYANGRRTTPRRARSQKTHDPQVAGATKIRTDHIRAKPRRPLVAKIHRDLLLQPLSGPGEIEKVSDGWNRALKFILNSYTPTIIGYGAKTVA